MKNNPSRTGNPRGCPSQNARGDGYYYRRYKQKQYPIHSDVPGTIYYCIQVDKERSRICCHTKDETIARQLIAKHLGGLDLTSSQKFLDSLAKAGDKAKAQLETHLTQSP